MSWEKKYWANRERQLRGLPPENSNSPTTYNRNNNGEIDITAMLAARLQQQHNTSPYHAGMPSVINPQQAQTNSDRMCTLVEGHEYYVKVQTGEFGGSNVLVRTVGVLQNLQGRTFEILSEVKAYVVDNLPTVDLSKIHEYDQKISNQLVCVRAPFVGTILVKKEAVRQSGAASLANGNILFG